ncbi:MAG: type II toxin-antitoxin system HicA family toxin [Nanoarchaeota archaeon]|nr:type II toxin-antitoxin system HicA family toxin [Nanoarchaeota archaeon]
MKLRNIKSKEVVKILQKFGFIIDRQSGTHIILKKEEKTAVVPVHRETMSIGTLKSI